MVRAKSDKKRVHKGRQCALDRSRKMTRIKKGLQKPDEYTLTLAEAIEQAGL